MTHGHTTLTIALAGLLQALQFVAPANAAETVTFAPGAYVMLYRDYLVDTDRFTITPPKGEGDACFRIDKVGKTEITMTLISGPYHPWWSDANIPPGWVDIWTNSPGYTENRPTARPLELLEQIFINVESCPAS